MTEPMPLSQFLSTPADPDATPVVGMLPVGAAEFSGVRYRIPAGCLAREVRGRKMRTVAGVYDEFAAAFQFPYYFGENKDAFDECLRDLDEFIGTARGYVVVVRNAALLLDQQPGERDWFADAMRDSAVVWARRDVLFRVVFEDAAPPGFPVVELFLDAEKA